MSNPANVVINGGAASGNVTTFSAPIIEAQPTFDPNGWQYQPDWIFSHCSVRASSADADSLDFNRYYAAQTKYPFDAGFLSRSMIDLTNWWVRWSVMGSTGPMRSFVGRIENAACDLYGMSTPTGKQTWIATGGLRLLQRQTISEAYFLNADNSTSKVGWIPPMNQRDKRGMITGNKSDNVGPNGFFFYGGKSIWSHLDYLNYVVQEFLPNANNPVSGQPNWSLGGQTDILDKIETSIIFEEHGSIAKMVKQLIPVKYGVDFFVMPVDDGFQITVFSRYDKDISFGNVTMSANPHTFAIDNSARLDVPEIHFVESGQKRVDKIVVMGKRIVVCGTLWGYQGTAAPITLVGKWAPALEADYIAANGAIAADVAWMAANPPPTPVTPAYQALADQNIVGVSGYDMIRKREKYRDVYQHLGAPDTWDMDGGAWSVMCNDDGTITTGPYQTRIRETLAWTPFRQGFDYTTNPPTDNTDGTVEPEISPPLAWIYDSIPWKSHVMRYIQCEHNGIGVQVPHLDWGVFLHASPNHALALNHWTMDQLATTGEPGEPLFGPEFDYTQSVATIAIESDHRLQIAYTVTGALAAGDGSVMTILDDEAELWVVLPKTIVEIDKKGVPIPFASAGGMGGAAPKGPTALRDDTDRLSLTMCGAIAQYANERGRAQITCKGLFPYSQFVGSIMTTFQQGADTQRVGAVITEISWSQVVDKEGKTSPKTIIKAGYA